MSRHGGLLGLTIGLVLAGCTSPTAIYGLRPQYPEALVAPGPRVAFVEVDSRQPTLRWEAFPTDDDRKTDQEGQLAKINNVTYDLRIFRARRGFPAEPIYTRIGLPEPWHTLDSPLEPSTEYFWTVRARFELDGRPRVTPWGRVALTGSHRLPGPAPLLLRIEDVFEMSRPALSYRIALVPHRVE